MLSLDASAEQRSFAASVAAVLGRRLLPPGAAPADVRVALGELGLFGIGTPAFGGDALDMVAGMRAAGAAGCQAPFLGALLAGRVLPPGDTDVDQDAVASGTATVSIASGGIAAWGDGADLVLAIDASGSVDIVSVIDSKPFDTLAGEPWSRVRLSVVRSVGARPLDLAFVELARAAWMVGAARSTLDLAAEHARHRRQFGKPIGDFQAVAHLLAGAAADVEAADDSVWIAAWRLEHEHDPAPAGSASIAAARSGLQAAFASHQAHGAIGFTVERGLDRLTAGFGRCRSTHRSPRWRGRCA